MKMHALILGTLLTLGIGGGTALAAAAPAHTPGGPITRPTPSAHTPGTFAPVATTSHPVVLPTPTRSQPLPTKFPPSPKGTVSLQPMAGSTPGRICR